VPALVNIPESQPADQDFPDVSDLLGTVRSAWRETLDFEPDDDETGFFDSGGDSHLLFVLVDRLTRVSGLKVKTLDVLKADTIRGQAELLARVRREQRTESADGT